MQIIIKLPLFTLFIIKIYPSMWRVEVYITQEKNDYKEYSAKSNSTFKYTYKVNLYVCVNCKGI